MFAALLLAFPQPGTSETPTAHGVLASDEGIGKYGLGFGKSPGSITISTFLTPTSTPKQPSKANITAFTL